MGVRRVCLSVIFSWFLVLLVGPVTKADYTAAVVEHKSISWLLPNVNRDLALAVINLNLDALDYHVSIASAKGADILVFPEYGITGFVKEDRDYVIPFLETVGDPSFHNTKGYIPCDNKHTSDTVIQYRLSCIALKHNITIVANLITVQHCDIKIDPHCPPDGRYQYNTDVAFSSDGELVAKYHKENLYSGEAKVFDPGHNQSKVAAFRTSFGYFGLFTCFDLLFPYPAERLVRDLGVDTMVFPTAWMNELPLLSAVEYQQAWSLSYGVNLLAANQHYPIAQMTGSGIFSPTTGAVTYVYDMKSILGTMLVARVQNPSQRSSRGQSIDLKDYPNSRNFKGRGTTSAGTNGGISSGLLAGIQKDSYDVQFEKKNLNSTHRQSNTASFKGSMKSMRSVPKYFTANLNDDPYNLTLIQGTKGRVVASNSNISCSLDFIRESDTEMYALGAFDGLHTMNGEYYIQCCSLIRCKSNSDPYQCGAEMSDAATVFQEFLLRMEGQSDQTRLFPEVITSGVGLPQVGEEWSYSENMDQVWSKGGILKKPLLAANIFGRWFQND